ncbi:cysteine desulfurase family protein [Paenibacillus segetis]|uniref:Aminotransferase V n=1 Tax=Paenibacillus segetis TaxID=1325360 RepID=A0ABQ1YJ65_9BACL|nr:cysteine desulfurase family protein [Paenibacillus segetis]GGH26560.1 aminotransferase V [Paenibacillus segetis]
MIYFDHAATSPPLEDVTRTMAEVMAQHYGNPSSLHRLGDESGKLLKKAREVCADALKVKPSEIVFTSGATESNNLALKGAAWQYINRGKHIVTTTIEHPSVFECCEQLQGLGWEVTYLPVNASGQVTVKQVSDAIREDTIVVSVMHVNNEIGTVQPIAEIGAMLKNNYPRVLFHVDGVQGFGKIPLSISDCGIDLYSLSAHKWRGPKGVGLLYVRDGLVLSPLMAGGGQEGGLRPGTENVPSIVGMAKAIRLASENVTAKSQEMSRLKEILVHGIQDLPQLVLNSGRDGAPHIVHFSYPGMKAEVILHMLEEEGFIVSTQSACSSKYLEPSRILLAMGKDAATASSGIRVSLGSEHTEDHINKLLNSLTKIINKLQKLKGEPS